MDGKRCEKCPENCLICRSKSECLRCTDSSYSHNGHCVNSCPKLYQPNSNRICVKFPCPAGCKTCKSANICLECFPPLILVPQGICLPCLKKKGLILRNGVCEEVCGDGILYNLSTSNHSCDNGNIKGRGGCSSDCVILSTHTCLREYTLSLQNFDTYDKCRRISRFSFFRNINNNLQV